MTSYTTFQDVIDHGFDDLGANPSEQVKRDCVRAALEAYRDLANAFNWSDLYTHSRVHTSRSFDGSQTGYTIQYQGTGGVYDRMVTISGGVWPDWAAEGTYLRLASLDDYIGGATVGYVNYRVAERKSATVITLTETLCPDADIPAGATFILYRDTYLLPDDYIAQDQALCERNFGGMSDSHPREWLYENRDVFAQGVPQMDRAPHRPVALRDEVHRLHHQAPPAGAGAPERHHGHGWLAVDCRGGALRSPRIPSGGIARGSGSILNREGQAFKRVTPLWERS